MAAIRVVTDGMCDLPQALADEHRISIVPGTVRFGSEEFVDRRDLTPDEFWARCAGSDVLPETSAPPPGEFEEAFREAFREGAEGVLCVTMSGKLSATNQSAQIAASAFADTIPVTVIDSRSGSLGLGLIVLEAVRRAEAGGNLAEATAAAQEAAGRSRVYGALDTLEYLRKGGRIASSQALLGSILSVKPIVEMRDGVIELGPRQRTRSKALRFLIDQVASGPPIKRLAVAHSAADDLGEFLDLLASHFPREEIIVGDLSPVIGAHLGPRMIGIAYLLAPVPAGDPV